jgi:hypothetical protein
MLLALAHWHGFTLADPYLDPVEKFHPGASRRERALHLGVPLAAISLGKPVQEGCLLCGGQHLNRALDVWKAHSSIVLLCARRSLTPQRRHRIDPRRAPRRQVTGGQRHPTQQRRYRAQHRRIQRPHAVKHPR